MENVKIAEMSEEEKSHQIDRIKELFTSIRSMLNDLEVDLTSENLMHQATSLWVSSNFCEWYCDFRGQIAKIDQSKKMLNDIENQIKDASNEHIATSVQ